MRFNHLLLTAALWVGIGFNFNVLAQKTSPYPQLQGDANSTATANLALEATFQSVKLDLLINEMEDAGFVMDVEEGFDEEWEEEIWVGSDADDVESLTVDPDEANLMDATAFVQPGDIAEDWDDCSWDDPAAALEDSEEFVMRGELEDLDADLWEETEASEFALVEEVTDANWNEEEYAWWDNEDGYDDSWEELMEEWEMDDLESEYELEDLDMLELMYQAQ
ncbi:MAG TPA: hypothetical protein ENJ82_15710 [Bacteroidetes bacterium]|nr:hypothetical protein [Bacteroidota bacterium]